MRQSRACRFEFDLAAGEFVDLKAEQQGIDVALTLRPADGPPLLGSDRLNAAFGPERIEACAPHAGTYWLELTVVGSATHGSVSVLLAARRPASARDRERAAAALLVQSRTSAALLNAQRLYVGWGDFELAALAARLRGVGARDAGRLDEARSALREARSLCRRQQDEAEEARVVADLADVMARLDATDEARELYVEALRLGHAHKELTSQAIALMGLGVLDRNEHRFEAARQHFSDAASLWRLLEDGRNEARTLTHAAIVATWLGRLDDARRTLEAAETLDREYLAAGLADSADWILDRAVSQAWFSWIEQLSGREQQATMHRDRAIKLYRQVNSVPGQIWMANTTGLAQARAGHLAGAREAYRQGLALAERDSSHVGLRARLLGNLGALELDHRDGQREAGLRALRDGLQLARTARDADEVAFCLRKLAEQALREGDLADADALTNEAWRTIESLRASGVNASGELQPDFLGARQEHAAARINVLVQRAQRERGRGFEERAFEFLELSRARAMREHLARSAPALDVASPAAERELLVDLVKLKRLTLDRVRDPPNGALATSTQMRALVTSLDLELRLLQARVQSLPVKATVKRAPRPTPLPDLARIRAELLDARTRILAVTLGDDDDSGSDVSAPARVWLVGPEHVQIAEVGAASAVRSWAETLRADWPESDALGPRQRALEAALALGRVLLPPAIRRQLVGVERLIVVTEGPLQHIPLAGLLLPAELDPRRGPWATRFDIVYAPSATTLIELRERARRRGPAPRAVAVLADPVFSAPNEPCKAHPPTAGFQTARARLVPSDRDSDRASAAAHEVGQRYVRRLCFSRQEAALLQDLVPSPVQRLERLEYAATRDLVRSGALAPYRVLHFATHGIVSPTAPELTGLVFSRYDPAGRVLDGFLGADDIASLSLRADLVVLSACRTGLGHDVRGEGLRGIAQAFMAAGANQVLASLWSVDDQATAVLMTHFYRGIDTGRDAARALRDAQNAMAHDPVYARPFFWAGFVLQGDGGAVRLAEQTKPLNAGLSGHKGRADSARRKEIAMPERSADRVSSPAPNVNAPSTRADRPHPPSPGRPPGTKPDGTLGDVDGLRASGRRHDDATSQTPPPPTPEQKLASNDPAVKILADPPRDATSQTPGPPTNGEKSGGTLGGNADATSQGPGTGPPLPKTEWVLRDGIKVLGNPWDGDGAFPRPIVDPPVKPLGSSGGFLGDEQ